MNMAAPFYDQVLGPGLDDHVEDHEEEDHKNDARQYLLSPHPLLSFGVLRAALRHGL
jgi:hypothetical protein